MQTKKLLSFIVIYILFGHFKWGYMFLANIFVFHVWLREEKPSPAAALESSGMHSLSDLESSLL